MSTISIVCDVPFEPMEAFLRTRMTAPQAVTVSGQLVAACPADVTPRTRAMCDVMQQHQAIVAGSINARKRRTPAGLRPPMADLDNSWGGIFQRLGAASRVPGGSELEAPAKALMLRVMPNGVADLKGDVHTKLIESKRMLDVIASEHLGPEIDRVAGPGFLAAAQRAHDALAEAAGLGSDPVRFGPRDVQLSLRNLTRSIQFYVIRLAAEVDPGDAESVRRFNAATAGLIRARAERAPVHEDTAAQQPTTTASASTPATATAASAGSNGASTANGAGTAHPTNGAASA